MKKLRKHFMLLLTLILCFAIHLYWGIISENFTHLAINQGFTASKIDIAGVDFFNKEDVTKTLDIKSNQPLFALDLNDLLAKLLLSHPWIKDARIERKYPDLIKITIEERKPICYFQKDYKIYLIDKDGVLMDGPKKLKNPIIVVGNNANKNASQLLSLLEKHNVLNVISASFIGNRRWNIELNKGIIVKLPEENLESAIRYLKHLISEKNILQKDINFIDLRLTDKIIVKENKTNLNYSEI